mmetsp:Transcript_14857/g.19852  ORF Transcript_14857/g.19852 Transcript_14857/m.19852 type:complete len:85 (-) Transcript_14857:56-310(-)
MINKIQVGLIMFGKNLTLGYVQHSCIRGSEYGTLERTLEQFTAEQSFSNEPIRLDSQNVSLKKKTDPTDDLVLVPKGLLGKEEN